MNEHKHIDPEPDRRYIIHRFKDGCTDSATVIEQTDHHVRLQWDQDGKKQWYGWAFFQPVSEPEKVPRHERYQHLRILEQLETPR